jgi:mannose-6-phosphate isomerase-like protein (cupin superfamily)
MRRIVTGEGPDGRSMSVSEGPPPRSVALRRRGDMTIEVLWEVAMPPQSPAAGGDADEHFPFEPPPGVARFGLLTIPPDSRVDRSSAAAVEAITAEIGQKIPGLLAALDPARGAGMHATATVDFCVVVSGRVILGLEDGQVELGPGDCVVQRGTWHAWRNPWEEPCVLAFTMLRTGPGSPAG